LAQGILESGAGRAALSKKLIKNIIA